MEKETEVLEALHNLSNEEAREMLDDLIIGNYTIVQWPYTQEYMDEDWFDKEAILCNSDNFGSAAYFIPIYRTM